MKKVLQHSTLIMGIMVLAAVVAVPALAMGRNANAQDAPSDGTTAPVSESNSPRPAQSQTVAEHQPTTVQQTSTDRRVAAQTRLQDAKLKSCQNREKAITNIMSRIADRGQKQLTLFSTIAQRTEAFYVKQGKTLSTYDQLVADVAAKQADAQTAVSAVTSQDSTFKCDGTDPKGFVNSFKDSLKSEIKALQSYRTAVKNLIVGVKSVESTTATSSNTSKVTN
jgi:hypothetical protein